MIINDGGKNIPLQTRTNSKPQDSNPLNNIKDMVEIGNQKEDHGFIKTITNPDVMRKGDPNDNFDSFKGVKMGPVHGGKFEEIGHKYKKVETVKATDIMPEEEALEIAKKMLAGMTSDFYKPDLSTLRLDPEGTITHHVKEDETFKGIAFGKHVKIGASERNIDDTPLQTLVFHFKGEVMGKKRDDIKFNYTVGDINKVKDEILPDKFKSFLNKP